MHVGESGAPVSFFPKPLVPFPDAHFLAELAYWSGRLQGPFLTSSLQPVGKCWERNLACPSPEVGDAICWMWLHKDHSVLVLPSRKKKKNYTVLISDPFEIVWKKVVNGIRIGLGVFLCSCTSSHPSLDGVPNQSIVSALVLWSGKKGRTQNHPSVTDPTPFLWLREWLNLSLCNEWLGLHIVKLILQAILVNISGVVLTGSTYVWLTGSFARTIIRGPSEPAGAMNQEQIHFTFLVKTASSNRRPQFWQKLKAKFSERGGQMGDEEKVLRNMTGQWKSINPVPPYADPWATFP